MDLKLTISPLRPVSTIPYHQLEPFLTSRENMYGTLRGSIVPTLEFMWSVIVFIRFGYILGKAGLVMALFLCIICSLVMVFTASSISSIATNSIHRVMEGGIYRILEKSLGKSVGSSIALLYYLGLTMLISIEIVGSGK